MRDEVIHKPYRVVIVTLDAHAAGPAARVSARLAPDFPGLEVQVLSAAEWGECPEALTRAKAAIATGDIIIANLLFLEEHINAILPAMAARRDSCDAMVGMIADAQVVKLTRMGDLDMGKPASGAMALLKKLRGSSKASASSGAKQMKTLRRLPKIWKSGSLACVHAAADPALPLTEQSRHTLLWGHSDFFNVPRSDGLWVAHGHTALPSPRFEQSRISLDTGAYVSGMLSAARVLPDGTVTFLWT